MRDSFHMKRHYWKYMTLFFSLMFFLVDEMFLYGLTYFPEEHRLFIHRSALFVIIVIFIAWTQAAISRILNMNNQMIQTAKLATLGEMAASVAHDIIRPIANVDMQIQVNLLKHNKHDKSDDFLEFNRFVKKQMEKCTSLVDSLRLFGRNSTNSPKLSNNLNDIILEALNLSTPYLAFTPVNKELSENLHSVNCNALQIEQVLANLIVNAKDALEKSADGLIAIRSFNEGDNVIIEIEDNGQGIAKPDLEYIFEPFYTTKSEGEGTGLGLAISNRIITDHQGSLGVESKAGSTIFRISLPC